MALRGLAVQEMHEPTDTEERSEEATKTIQTVAESRFIRAFGDKPQNDAGDERKEQRRFEMI
jgi:hypothetical protein